MPIDRKEYMKEYRLRNKDKIKERTREYNKRNRDKIREYKKEYDKAYHEKNRDKIREYKKEYSQTENGKKTYTIGSWKKHGLIHDDYDALYEKYINTDKCEICNKVFENSFYRCMDHDHITGEFRYILCRTCNNMDSWKNKL